VFKILSIVREIHLKRYWVPEIVPGLFGSLLILQVICLDIKYFEITEPATFKYIWLSRHDYRQKYSKYYNVHSVTYTKLNENCINYEVYVNPVNLHH